MTISLICPTRGRPQQFRGMVQSAVATADGEIEVMAGISKDDPTWADYLPLPTVAKAILLENRIDDIGLAVWNNMLCNLSKGNIMALVGDDMRIRTPGWDTIALRAMPVDGIAVLYPQDGVYGNATFPMFSRAWLALCKGTIAPTNLQRWYIDQWPAEIARMIGRLKKLENVLFEHLHPMAGKAMRDDTYRRLTHEIANEDAEQYHSKELTAERARLAAVMEGAMVI